MRWTTRIALLANLLLAVGCSNAGNNSDPSRSLTNLQSAVESLKAETESLKSSLQAQKALSVKIQSQVSILQMRQQQWTSASFDPVTEQGFARADTSVATLLVAISDIKSYADGIKISLSVGNTSSATLSNVDGTATFGASQPDLDWIKDEQAIQKFNIWRSSLKTRDFSINGNLAPGTWNPVTVTLPGISLSKFGHLEISMSAKTVFLRKIR